MWSQEPDFKSASKDTKLPGPAIIAISILCGSILLALIIMIVQRRYILQMLGRTFAPANSELAPSSDTMGSQRALDDMTTEVVSL